MPLIEDELEVIERVSASNQLSHSAISDKLLPVLQALANDTIDHDESDIILS